MRPRHPRSGITLLSLLVVMFILSLWAAVQIAQNADDRRRAVELRAEVALKQIVSTEGVWRGTDSDRNGSQDYWTRDVAGFYYRANTSQSAPVTTWPSASPHPPWHPTD
jgi:hypothetical protein